MSDVNANIGVHIDTSQALAELKSLQRQLATFYSSIAKSSAAAVNAQRNLQLNLLSNINASGQFATSIGTIKTSTEAFTTALEKNKFSMREYFRYAGGATKTFGRVFKSEFDTIGRVAEDRVKKLQTQYIKIGRDATGAMRAIAITPNTLDLKDYGTQAQISAQRQALFNQLVKQGSTNLLNFGKNTQWAGRQLMVGFTLPLASLGVTAAKTFMDMETAAIKFKKVYGDLGTSPTETKDALAGIQELAKTYTQYGVAVKDTISLAADAAAAGFKGVELQKQTAAATKLSVLGQIDSQQALQTTISLQNAFGTSAEDLANTIDFLNAVENQTVTSLDDITIAIPKAAPVVKQLGGNVKDLAYFLTAMKEGGVNASEGANALKSGLSALINPSKKASDMLGSVGINIRSIVDKNKGNLKQTVLEFAQALDTLAPLDRARAIETMFGKFQFARISTLLQNITKDGTQASRVLDLAGASAADLANLSQQELGTTADSAMNKFRGSVEKLKVALVPIGETLLKTVSPIVDFVSNVLDKFNNLSDGVKKAIVVLTVTIGAIGPVALMTFGLLANGFANIMKGVMVLRQGYLRLTGQSKNLGEQTQYLTNEQLDAAAVAHSLDQSHAKLIQTFNVEASALASLTSAYQRAIAAGEAFAFNNPGMMRPGRSGRKFASGGIVVGPGTGTSDSIPAMLSNGESVIPARQTKKYGTLIRGIISDSIPGYRKGRVGSGSQGRIGKANATVLIPYRENVSQTSGAVNFTNIDPNNLADIASMYAQEIMKQSQVSVANINTQIKAWEQTNRSLIDAATLATNNGMDATEAFSGVVNKFVTDMESAGGPVSKFASTAKRVAPELQKDLIQAQEKAKQLNLNVKNASDAMRLATELPNNIIAQKMTKPGSFGSLSRLRSAASSMLGGIGNIATRGIPSFMITPGIAPSSPAYLARSSQEHFSTTVLQEQNLASLRTSQSRLRQQAIDNANMAIDATAKAAQVASPSKRTISIGKDIAEGLRVGMQQGESSVAAGGVALSDKAIKATQSRLALYGNGPIDAGQKSLRRQLENQQKQMRIGDLAATAAVSKETLNAAKENARALQAANARMASLNKAFMAGTFALTTLSGMASMAGGNLGKFSDMIFQISGPIFALSSIIQMITGSKIVEFISKFKVGLGIGTVALAAAVVGYKLINGAMEKHRLQLEGLSNAMTTTTEQLKTLGNFFGVAPKALPYDLAQKQNLEQNVTSNVRSQREDLKANSAFQKQYKDTIKSLSNATVDQARLALSSLALDLKAKGFATEQVQVIVDALREEAGKTDVVLDVKSINLDPANLAQMKKDLIPELNAFSEAFKKSFKETSYMITQGDGKGGVITQLETFTTMSDKAKASLNNLTTFIATTSKDAAAMFRYGLINGDQFRSTLSTVLGTLNGLDAQARKTATIELFKKMNADAAGFITNIKSAQTQMKILALMSSGLLTGTSKQYDASGKVNKDYNPILGALAQPSTSKAFQRGVAAVNKEYSKLEKLFSNLGDLEKKANAGGTTTIPTTGPKTPLQELQDKVKAMRDQVTVFELLRKKNVDYATAIDMASDATMRSLVLDAAKKGTLKNVLDLMNELTAKQKEYENLQKSLATPEDKRLAQLTQLQAAVALNEKLIDIQNAPAIKKYNDQIREQEKALKGVNDKIKERTKKFIDPLQEQIDANNYKLEGIALKEDAINEKYNEQIDALTKIETINQSIANIQKQRISLADAVTSGDISAAASMVQDIRAQQAQDAMTSIKDNLTNAKDQQIQALGRVELEKQNKELQYQISTIQKEQLSDLEKQKTQIEDNLQGLRDQLSALEDQVAQTKENYRYAGLTKDEINNQKDLIGLAKDAGIAYNDVLGKAAQNASAMAAALQAALAAQLSLMAMGNFGASSGSTTTYTDSGSGGTGGIDITTNPTDKSTSGTTKTTSTTSKTVTVKSGQTLSSIAKANGTTVSAILAANPKFTSQAKYNNGNTIFSGTTVKIPGKMYGGLVAGFGMTDTVPTLLTPGEFVMNRNSTRRFLPMLKQMNQSLYPGSFGGSGSTLMARVNTSNTQIDRTVYNYNLSVTANSTNANPHEIAQTVIAQIKRTDAQRVRGNRA